MYGSELRLSWFPRPNDLGRFAEFAIANLAAGLPEPARSAATRLRNLHDGIGLVADLGVGRLPADARGALAAPPHLGRARRAHARPRRGEPRGGPRAGDRGPGRRGRPSLVLELPHQETLRCWSVGFLVGTGSRPAGAARRARGRRPIRSRSRVDLPASDGAGRRRRGGAGALPRRAPAASASAASCRPRLLDLFAVSTG